MTKTLVRKYALNVSRGHNKELQKLFHKDAVLIDEDGNMRTGNALYHYFNSLPECTYRVHDIKGAGKKFTAIGALEHENKSTRLKKDFVFSNNKIKSIVVKRL